MYLALPAGDDPMLIHRSVGEGTSILELGSGPGRLTRVLFALGHDVVAVDDSEEMLSHVTGAETVCGDLFDLELRRKFDVVLAASHLINHADSVMRRSLLDVCKRHLRPSGSVLIQRLEPGWPPNDRSTGSVGPIDMTFTVRARTGDVVAAAMEYRLGSQSWTQDFEAVDVDDGLLDETAVASGLRVEGPLNDAKTWLRLGHS